MTGHNLLPIFQIRYLKYLIPCFILGICILFLLPSASLREVDILIPVDYHQIPAGLTMTQPLVSGIEVRIKGTKSAIKALSAMQLRYELDLSETDIGLNSITINQNQVQLPSGVSIINVKPTHISVRIEKELEKELPVKIFLSGKAAAGYSIANTIARPLSVTLRGPETVVSPMKEAVTKPIPIRGLSESFKKEIALDLPEEVQLVSPSNIIFAEVRIEEMIIVKKIDDILVAGNGSPYNYEITPATIDIEVKGPANILGKIDKENGINVYVDLQGLTPGVYIRRAAITLPVKTALVGVKPEIFTIKITKAPNNN